jgi:E3 ubiquitin-protein ligase TRIP12
VCTDGVFGSRPPSKSGKVRIKREDTSPALDLAAAPVASGSGGPPAAISPLRDAIKAESSPAPGDFSGSPAAFALASNRAAHLVRDREAVNKRRVALLTEGSEERLALVRRYHLLMLPTLVDVYAASVGVQVRTKALLGMSKIVHYCPEVDLRTAVKVSCA